MYRLNVALIRLRVPWIPRVSAPIPPKRSYVKGFLLAGEDRLGALPTVAAKRSSGNRPYLSAGSR